MSKTASDRFGPVAIVGAAMLWGTTGTAATFFPEGISPIAIGAATMVGGGFLLFVISFRRSILALKDSAARKWLFLGAVGVFIYPLAFYTSMDLAGVAVGNVVSLGTGPVFAAILERFLERRSLTLLWGITTLLALVGVSLLVLGGSGEPSGTSGKSVVVGVALGLLAGLSYALYTYSSTRVIRAGHSSGSTMGAMFGVGAIALLPILVLWGGPILDSGASVGVALYLAVGPMFLAYILFGIGLRSTPSSTATTITLLEPVVATLLAVMIVGEALGPISWVGLALIFVAVSVLSTARHPRKQLVSP